MSYSEFIINSQEELVEYVSNKIDENEGTNKQLTDILNEAGIQDTVNLIDDRTIQLLKLYEFYKNNPSQLDYGIFFNIVLLLNPIFKVNYGY